MRTDLIRNTVRAAACALGVATIAALAGCGGGDGGSLDQPVPPPASLAQQAKQQAALERAHALNVDALGQIKAERNARRSVSR